MSTARSRPPTGRVNTPLHPISPNRQNISTGRNRPVSSNGYPMTKTFESNNQLMRSNPSSSRSELSTDEVIRRLKDQINEPKKLRDTAEIMSLGNYNAFSRPRVSTTAALRSVFLDPEVNNFPPSKTRSELMKKIKVSGAPHPSYDLVIFFIDMLTVL